MATSSFFKTFVFNANATKKVQSVQKLSGVRVPLVLSNKVRECQEALARFSPRSKT